MKITVAVGQERNPVQVRAWPVEIEGFPNLAVHRCVTRDGKADDSKTHNRYYSVTETTTGMAVFIGTDQPRTRQQAIEAASERLRLEGIEKFNKCLAKNPKWCEVGI